MTIQNKIYLDRVRLLNEVDSVVSPVTQDSPTSPVETDSEIDPECWKFWYNMNKTADRIMDLRAEMLDILQQLGVLNSKYNDKQNLEDYLNKVCTKRGNLGPFWPNSPEDIEKCRKEKTKSWFKYYNVLKNKLMEQYEAILAKISRLMEILEDIREAWPKCAKKYGITPETPFGVSAETQPTYSKTPTGVENPLSGDKVKVTL